MTNMEQAGGREKRGKKMPVIFWSYNRILLKVIYIVSGGIRILSAPEV